MERGRFANFSLRGFLLRQRDRLFARTRVVSAILAVALGLLIWPGLGLRTPLYEVGEIAPRTVRATEDFTYEDAATTEERRREAVEQVREVYDFDSQARDEARARIARGFGFGRAAVESDIAGEPDFPETFARMLGIEVTAAQLQLLVELEFAEEMEQNLADTVASVLARDILAEKGAVAALGRSILRRDPQGGETEPLADFTNVLSVEEAQRAVELQILALSELNRTRRRTLGELAARLMRPTLEQNTVETTHLRTEAEQSVNPVFIQVRRGRTLVRAGDEVTELARYQMERMRPPRVGAFGWTGVGAIVFALTVVVLLGMLLVPARRDEIWGRQAFAMCGFLIVLHLTLTRVLAFVGRGAAAQLASEPFSDPSVYLWGVPFAALALLVVILETQQSAVITQGLFAATLALMTGNLKLGLFALLTGFGAIFIYQVAERRSQLLRVGTLVGLLGVGPVVAMELVTGDFGGLTRLSLEAVSAFAGGLLCGPLVILLLPVLESVFERTSEMRLVELSQRDSPLLRQLALTAPGTYQHSVTVGVLSESAADAIGANSTFCATAALYHDIGKLNRAGYFIENIRGESPHDLLPPEKSADIIRRHVSEGIEAAERLNLPKDIVDVIPQHHGTRLIRVFYEKARTLAAQNGSEADESLFRYAGPRPQTRETAIIMMADSIEAAARSLKNPTGAEFEEVIDRIMGAIVDDDQLVECDLTLGDMVRIRESFLSSLQGIHHERVPYPGFDFGRRQRAGTPAPGPALPAAGGGPGFGPSLS